MFYIFLGLLCCVLSLQFFVVYCRALLAESAQVELSPSTISDFCVKEGEASGGDFPRMVALVELCQELDGLHGLRFVEIYYRLLTPIQRVSAGAAPRLAKRIERERRACTTLLPLSSRSGLLVRADSWRTLTVRGNSSHLLASGFYSHYFEAGDSTARFLSQFDSRGPCSSVEYGDGHWLLGDYQDINRAMIAEGEMFIASLLDNARRRQEAADITAATSLLAKHGISIEAIVESTVDRPTADAPKTLQEFLRYE